MNQGGRCSEIDKRITWPRMDRLALVLRRLHAGADDVQVLVDLAVEIALIDVLAHVRPALAIAMSVHLALM